MTHSSKYKNIIMDNINNWTELVSKISQKNNSNFQKLLLRTNQSLRSFQKSNENFDMNTVLKNHFEIFSSYKLIYEQLQIESDITDIFVDIPSLDPNFNINLTFNMVGVGKWIKIHNGNASRIFFFDEEKTILSDKTLADFLNKISYVRSKYKYFDLEPIVYYKFKIMPSTNVIDYLKQFNVIAVELQRSTPLINYPRNFNQKVVLDQTMILTMCSHLSHGLSESFYTKPEDKNKEIMLKNKENLDNYLSNKIIFVNQSIYDQTKHKIYQMGGPMEQIRFEEFCSKIQIVSDCSNPRFYYLKDAEQIYASVAEREYAIIVTSNQRLCNKIDTYYSEISYKLFIGAQLTENKFS